MTRTYPGKEFPRLTLAPRDLLPARSVARRAVLAPGARSDWAEAPADEWAQGARGSICEQSIGQQKGFRLTLLTYEAPPDDADEDEEVERTWAPPQFRRQ